MIENAFIIYLGLQKGPKRPQKRRNLAFSGIWLYGIPYFMKRVGTTLQRHIGHPGRSVWPICQTLNVPNEALRGPKRGKIRLEIALWPHKSAHRADFGLEGVEKVVTPNKTSRQTSLGHLLTLNVPNVAQRGAKIG